MAPGSEIDAWQKQYGFRAALVERRLAAGRLSGGAAGLAIASAAAQHAVLYRLSGNQTRRTRAAAKRAPVSDP